MFRLQGLMALVLLTCCAGTVEQVDAQIAAALASVSELIFFLLGAMTIVEVVDSHGGFNRLSAWVRADQRSTLTWFVAALTFGMSAVLDNLTTTIVMVSVLQVGCPAALCMCWCFSFVVTSEARLEASLHVDGISTDPNCARDLGVLCRIMHHRACILHPT